MMSATPELDPTILKALGYFRSSAFDSTEKLKAMLTEVVENSKRGFDGRGIASSEKNVGKSSKTGSFNDFKKRDNHLHKRQIEKMQDSSEIGMDLAKKPYFAPSSVDSTPSKSSISMMSPANGAFGKPDLVESVPEDFALEMAGLACAMCKEMTFEHGNQLVECQDCHSLYHQDCHQPPVTDKDINDPRHVWYCAKCQQNMKQENSVLQSSVSSRTSVSPIDLTNEKTTKIKTKPSVTPFKRSEIKSSLSSSNNSSGVPLSGWAALSGKSPTPSHKSSDESGKESKSDNGVKKPNHKEKSKTKNHSKSVLLGSDAWAEALGAKSSSNDKPKSSSSKTTSSNNSSKHSVSLSSMPWLSTPGSNISAKKPNSSSKSAPFPKANASSGPVVKSLSTRETATKQMQIMKKKAAAKMQQKRARI